MYAVIKSGGKQHVVTPGQRVKLEKIGRAEGEPVVFDQVLMIKDGDEVKVGTPLLTNARVKGVIEGHGRDRKIIVFKFKRRKGYRKKQGHRQDYTTVRIDEIHTDVSAGVEG